MPYMQAPTGVRQIESLLLLSRDLYWEQDSDFRFRRLETFNRQSRACLLITNCMGQTPTEAGFRLTGEASWSTLRDRLLGGESCRDVVLEGRETDGNPLYLSITAEPISQNGRIVGYRGVADDITRKYLNEQDLLRFRAAMDASEDMVFLVDRETMEYIYINDKAIALSGYTREELQTHGPHHSLPVTRDELARSYDELIASASGGTTLQMHTRTKDGTLSIIEMHRRAQKLNGRWVIITTAHDISQRVQAERARDRIQQMFAALSATNEAIMKARSPEALYEQVCHAAVDGGRLLAALVMRPSTAGDLTVIAAAGARRDEYLDLVLPTAGELQGLASRAYHSRQTCVSHDFLSDSRTQPWHDDARALGIRSAAAVPLVDGERVSGVLLFFSEDRRKFNEGVVGLLERMAANIIFALENFRHEEERKHNEQRVHYLATHDSLTGLPNRAMFNELLRMTLDTAARYQQNFALLFIDLDRFKLINDTLGHEAGDLVLKTVADRLSACLRGSDVIARLGGDEFIVLLPQTTQRARITAVARKLLAAALEPVHMNGQDLRVTASIGVARYPLNGEDARTLLRAADQAMYLAKEEGKNTFEFFSRKKGSRIFERLAIETNLRLALQQNELSLRYQAKKDLKNGRINGVEALLRWKSAALGSVTPMQFIPVAEQTGLIIPIGRWVLKTACQQNMQWQAKGLPLITMAVNLSPRQLMDPSLVSDVREILAETGMAAHLLELEVTESMLMTNSTQAIEVLTALRNMGVRTAIDDFGTGYSSLAQLKNFPVDTLKVDRSFIRDLPFNKDDRTITEIIIAMGRSLHMKVIAEGVETEAQQEFLKQLNCDEVQGFYFSKPLRPDTFSRLLSRTVDNTDESMPTSIQDQGA